MPDRPLPIGTYVMGASLCAISLLYVFGPAFAFNTDSSSDKKGIVGLDNPSNMCFCNSVLQALANLPSLRHHLIMETHRRRLDESQVYTVIGRDHGLDASDSASALDRLPALQQAIVTLGLKRMLDKLNERPLQRKTVTATDFILCLETAFQTRISRQQQDAQEFLQILLERLSEEYYAGYQARRDFHKLQGEKLLGNTMASSQHEPSSSALSNIQVVQSSDKSNPDRDDAPQPSGSDNVFPFEGQIEAQIECGTCSFRPKPSISTFVTLTLNVPQMSTVSLNQCFDGILREETIDDFRCDKCRLTLAKHLKEQALNRAIDQATKFQLLNDLTLIDKALGEDPERHLPDAHLPDAPKRTIKRAMRISRFPKVLAIHLSRSIYSVSSMSTKNLAKVSFPDTLALGGLAHPHSFRLSSVVMHKGGHNSGHYETFRRQHTPLPFSTPNSFGAHSIYKRTASTSPSVIDTPAVSTTPSRLSSRSTSSASSSPHRLASKRPPVTTAHRKNPPILAAVQSTTASPSSQVDHVKLQKKQKRLAQRWWHVSDDRVRECKTGQVLSLQREIYMLFYEADD